MKDFGLSFSELSDVIDEWILSERDRRIAKRRFLDGITYEKIAEEFDLSTQHVQKIIKRCIEKVEKTLKK